MIDKFLISQRKEVYGNNFPDIAEVWSKYLGMEIRPEDVAMMMAEMKQVRINFCNKQIDDLNVVDKETYLHALVDSQTDKENYLFIATNYSEYEKL